MRFTLHSLSFSAVLAAATLLSASAHAEVKPYPSCERDPTESDVSAAKGAYEAGQVSFQEADYERALLYWEDAFRRDCTAVKLLLNIARAYELSGDLEHAVNSLQTYVDRRPDAKDRGSVEKRIEKLQERLNVQEEEAPPPVVDEPEEEEEETEQEEEKAVAVSTSDQSGAKKPKWPIWVTGGGILVALVGHGIYAQGEQLRQDRGEELGCNLAENKCPSDAASEEANQAGLDERRSGAVVATVGHVAGITGGIFWWYLWTRDSGGDTARLEKAPLQKRTILQPVVAPGYQGLSLSGRF